MNQKTNPSFFKEAGLILGGMISLAAILHLLTYEPDPNSLAGLDKKTAGHEISQETSSTPQKTQVTPPQVTAVAPATPEKKVAHSSVASQRPPGASVVNSVKGLSFEVQQARKRFLAACLTFENKPKKRWKKVMAQFPELRANYSRHLTAEWSSLAMIVNEGVSTQGRKTASVESERKKLKDLREKFLRQPRA